jgi:anti-anti-sigma factor
VREAQAALSVDMLAGDDSVRIRLAGELDVSTSPLLQTVVEQALAGRRQPRCRLLVLDMGEVTFADASGLCPVLLARAVLARRGGRVELRHCRPAVRRLLRVLDLDDLQPAEAG